MEERRFVQNAMAEGVVSRHFRLSGDGMHEVRRTGSLVFDGRRTAEDWRVSPPRLVLPRLVSEGDEWHLPAAGTRSWRADASVTRVLTIVETVWHGRPDHLVTLLERSTTGGAPPPPPDEPPGEDTFRVGILFAAEITEVTERTYLASRSLLVAQTVTSASPAQIVRLV